ncbi:uncharacterized protein [Paramisgurnus dabryanus]|uniref:uncharacterized protein isoform X2 n=1 Tax=Paramisgurnus dabryanus TaxID=90735 RepID=UPI003CCF9771
MMIYTFQDGDAIQPVSFLDLLRLPIGSTTTTLSPMTSSKFPLTSQKPLSGSAVVTSKLVFNSSSPVPSETQVLSAIQTLRNSRESQLGESVKVANVTYEKISDTSYAVIFIFTLSNISIPEDPNLKNNTYNQVQNTVNTGLNTLLNGPNSTAFEPTSSDFTSTPDQINGLMVYTFQDGDAIQPVSFLDLLRLPIGSTTTTVSTLTSSKFPLTSQKPLSGSAVVTSKLVFNSSSPVPSETQVLSAIQTLRNSRESQLGESVKVANVTYEKISDTSYAVIIIFTLSNISIPEDPELKNSTFNQVKNIVNNALNTLLNGPSSPVFEPTSSDFTSKLDQINGTVDYTFQDGDVIKPVSFLDLLNLPIDLTTTKTPTTTTTQPPTVLGKVVIYIELVFITFGQVPSEESVLQIVHSFLDTGLRIVQSVPTQNLSDPVSFVNITYHKLADNKYSINFGFEIKDVLMFENPDLRNDTFPSIQDKINGLLNKILSDPSGVFNFKATNFTGNSTAIRADVQYVFNQSDIHTPSLFVQELLKINGVTSTPAPTVLGKVIIFIKLVFITRGPAPSEESVLQIANSLLDVHLRTVRSVPTQTLNDPVSIVNITYEKLADNQYSINFGFAINDVNMSEKIEFRNETYKIVQDKINELLNKILNDPTAAIFKFNPAMFTGNSTVIRADVQYIFNESDIGKPSIFVEALLKVNGVITTAAPARTTSMVVNTTGANNSSAAWVVAIIVPCAIAIMLVPCWILLCCLLCGCCTRIRRRWHRRQSYNIQYTTHNLF